MSSLQLTFEKLVRSLLLRLEDDETRETDLLIRLESCIRSCEESLQWLRQWVTDNSFPDNDSEIYFFKQVKPVIMAKYIYYQKIYHLHIGYFNGCGLLEKERLTRELQEIERYFVTYNSLYAYYRMGCTHHDQFYFLRDKCDWKTCSGIPRIGDIFSTNADEQLASLMAHEWLLKYIDGLLCASSRPTLDTSGNTSQPTNSSGIRCTASITNIVELGYALHAFGFFNDGKASIKEVMHFLSEALHINLHNHSHTFFQIRERKHQTRFLDELKADLLRYINQLE